MKSTHATTMGRRRKAYIQSLRIGTKTESGSVGKPKIFFTSWMPWKLLQQSSGYLLQYSFTMLYISFCSGVNKCHCSLTIFLASSIFIYPAYAPIIARYSAIKTLNPQPFYRFRTFRWLGFIIWSYGSLYACLGFINSWGSFCGVRFFEDAAVDVLL